MVEIDVQPWIGDSINELGEESEKPVDRNRLVVKRRQHQHIFTTGLQRVDSKVDCIRERTRSIPNQQPGGTDSRTDDRLQETLSFHKRKRVCFGRGSKNDQPIAAML